jgi:hypothetical protein
MMVFECLNRLGHINSHPDLEKEWGGWADFISYFLIYVFCVLLITLVFFFFIL